MEACRLALVTGATSGIGRAYAERFAHDGFDLIITGRRKAALGQLAAGLKERCGVQVTAVIAELSQEKDVAALVRRVQRLQRLDALVNNAGYGTGLPFRAAAVEDHLKMVAVHVTAAMRLIHAALPRMAERRSGTIITVASLAAFLPLPNSAVYCGTKAFLDILTESIAMEVAGLGIRVQSLCPGLVDTDFHRRNARRRRAGRTERRLEVRSSGLVRWATAEQVVERSFRDLARGRVLCIPGFWNRVGFFLVRLMPRRLYARAVGRLGRFRSGTAGETDRGTGTRNG
jgi:short-subunit dehydrogenase